MNFYSIQCNFFASTHRLYPENKDDLISTLLEYEVIRDRRHSCRENRILPLSSEFGNLIFY